MEERQKEQLAARIKTFYLPRYREIPNVGLYLEQTTTYIMEFLKPLGEISITGSMISNYVKKKMIDSPVRKQYDREQIAQIIFIAIAKSVISLENIKVLLQLQKSICESAQAYDYFCDQLMKILYQVFELEQEKEEVPAVTTAKDERQILQNLVITVAHKIYLDACFTLLGESKEEGK